EDMFTYNPEVAVFIVGANDAKTLQDGDERDPDWRTRYSALVEKVLTVLRGNGRAVYWVGAPVMADSAYSERVKAVNEVFRDVAARHPGVVYVAPCAVFSTRDGTYAPTLPVPGGKISRVRSTDGIHFTPEGGDLLAKRVFDRLDPACEVAQEAVPGAGRQRAQVRGARVARG